MLSLALEGFEAAIMSCTLVVLVIGFAVMISGRGESTPAVAGFIGGVLIVTWLRFDGTIGDVNRMLIALALGVATALLVAPLISRLDILAVTAGVLAGGSAAVLWVPCVGPEFSELLVEIPNGGMLTFIRLTLYMFGVLSPLLLAASILHMIPKAVTLPIHPVMLLVGGAIMTVAAVSVAIGIHDTIIDHVVGWSISASFEE